MSILGSHTLSTKLSYFKDFARFWDDGLDLLFPPSCQVCRGRVDLQLDGMICKRCWDEIFQPVSIPMIGGSITFSVLAAGDYRGPLRDLIRRAKFSADPLPLTTLVLLLKRTVEEKITSPVDLVTSVPGSPERLRERGVDLPGILARRLAGKLGIDSARDIVTRTREVPPQMSLKRAARLENLKGAFACEADLKGRNLLIMDDVVTTGATALALFDALRETKMSSVTFLATAHTPEGMEDSLLV